MVSICMISYNGERFIQAQLESIISQIGENDEVIISDNGSTDRTLEIIRAIGDNRIRILNFPKRREGRNSFQSKMFNIAKNMENALQAAKGDIIFFSDQDDVWLPERYKKLTSLLKDADLVYSDAIVTDENLQVISPSYFSIKSPSRTLAGAIIRTPFLGCGMAFRRSVLDISLPLPSKPVMHDIWIAIKAIMKGRIAFCNEPTLLYRRHNENSSTLLSSKNPLFLKLKIRYWIVSALLKKRNFIHRSSQINIY